MFYGAQTSPCWEPTSARPFIPREVGCVTKSRTFCVPSSSLRPSLKPMVKSRILHICLQSLYKLPPSETLKTCLPPLELASDVMVTARFLALSVFLGGQS